MTYKQKRKVLLLLLALLIVIGCLYALLESRRNIVQSPTASVTGGANMAASTLASQAAALHRAYRQMRALGWNDSGISYGDNASGDLWKRQKLVGTMSPPSGSTAFADAQWQLGGGYITDEQQAQRAFFISGLTQNICRALNTQLWHDSPDSKPKSSSVSIKDWRDGTANTVALFDGRNRSEACILIQEGLYLYYKAVGSSLRMPDGSLPPPPTIRPPPPLPPGTDPELSR